MAQASSAQREPSMEEILASIRRIIEDSETGRKDDKPEAANAPGGGDSGEVETFRAELKPVVEPEPEADEADEEDEMSLDPFEWPRHETAPSGGDVEAPAARMPEPEPARAAQPEPAPSIEHEAARTQLAPVTERPSAESARGSILSEASGRKVAAAFEELNEAFEANRRKSLDEAAEEMLRPMLQEWLDNNLPQMVERLVREEIERVARGG